MSEHTPLPWQVQEPDTIDVFVPIIGVILGDDGQPLETPTNGLVGGATLFPTEVDAEDYERAKANADFIVRAVNSHYALVEALQWALDELNGRTRYDEDVADQQIENCYRLAEKALNLASKDTPTHG